MLTPAHIAVSYILAKSAPFFGYSPTPAETALIIIAGNIVDVDFLYGLMQGKRDDQHHVYATHTPAGILLIWSGWLLLWGNTMPLLVNLFIAAALMLHLLLDDLGYLLHRMHLQELSPYPQINWLYPFTKSQIPQPPSYHLLTLKLYLKKARMSAFLEAVLILVAALLVISG